MNEIIKVGEINSLQVARASEPGIYLKAKDEEEVLLPNAYVKKEMEIDSFLDVFIYTDSEDRLVATTQKPYVYVNDFAYLEVVDMAKFGAFVDIGLAKDILVPQNRQKSSFHIGAKKVVQLQLDERTNRLIASEKYQLDQDIKKYELNDEVEILVFSNTPLGFKVIVENSYEGMIFHNEIFESIKIGDRKRAYIKNQRDDLKLDISLRKIGQKVSEDSVLEVLKRNDGEINFTYKSDALDIRNTFNMSKKAFKASLTKLLNEEKIELLESSIRVKK